MGTTTHKVRLAVTAGDPFGIGPEVIVSSVAGIDAHITIFGDPAQFPTSQLPHDAVVVPIPTGAKVPEPRAASEPGGRAALACLDAAIDAIKQGRHDALVTGPISKEACALSEGPADGHTPILERAFDARALMTFVWDESEPAVALLTHHIPLRAVAATLTSDKVEQAIRTLHGSLKRIRGNDNPNIAVLGLNPHAGEGGRMGTEEIDFIAPAVERLRGEGLRVEGPLPGDSTFAHRSRFDGILAMYHDQGLAPVKALAFDRAVQVTLGLPVIRTSPSHGTAFDIAGQGVASANSMRAAMNWAIRLVDGGPIHP
jgi:4-hydroxythreonine-4-phosphate dehydrogenase